VIWNTVPFLAEIVHITVWIRPVIQKPIQPGSCIIYTRNKNTCYVRYEWRTFWIRDVHSVYWESHYPWSKSSSLNKMAANPLHREARGKCQGSHRSRGKCWHSGTLFNTGFSISPPRHASAGSWWRRRPRGRGLAAGLTTFRRKTFCVTELLQRCRNCTDSLKWPRWRLN
jgi:hypothetical protein